MWEKLNEYVLSGQGSMTSEMDPTLTNAQKSCSPRRYAASTDAASPRKSWPLPPGSMIKRASAFEEYENEYPDSNKLFKSIDSKGGLVAKGLIVKVGDRTFRLAAGGIAAGSRLSPASPEVQLKLDRDLATAVNKLVSHPVFAEWLTDPTKPTKFSAAGQFWGVAPYAARRARSRCQHRSYPAPGAPVHGHP